MPGPTPDAGDGAEWARRIGENGWRQCSVFRPPADFDGIPAFLGYNPTTDWLVVCTQACSIVGDNFDREPAVEAMVARPLPSFDPGSLQARGRDYRELHLPVSDLPAAAALACLLPRRLPILRRHLADWSPENAAVGTEALKAFQAWIAAHYTRIALPDALVRRLKEKGGLVDVVRKALRRSLPDGVRVHERVGAFYARWSPDEELPADLDYEFRLLVSCDDDATADELGDALRSLESGFRGRPVARGVRMEAPTVAAADGITLAQLRGMMRFSEWDSLSGPEELIPRLSTP